MRGLRVGVTVDFAICKHVGLLPVAVDCRYVGVVFVPEAFGLEVIAQVIVFVADLVDLGCCPLEGHGLSPDRPLCVVDYLRRKCLCFVVEPCRFADLISELGLWLEMALNRWPKVLGGVVEVLWSDIAHGRLFTQSSGVAVASPLRTLGSAACLGEPRRCISRGSSHLCRAGLPTHLLCSTFHA